MIAQQVKALATKPVDLNLTHETHMVERENQLSQTILWLLHECHGVFISALNKSMDKCK